MMRCLSARGAEHADPVADWQQLRRHVHRHLSISHVLAPCTQILNARVYRVRHRDQVLPFALCEAETTRVDTGILSEDCTTVTAD